MASLPVYFEQRPIGTIHVDASGPSFTYAPGWIGLRGAFPISLTMPLKSQHFTADIFLPQGGKPTAGKRAAANSRATSWDGTDRCYWSPIRDRR